MTLPSEKPDTIVNHSTSSTNQWRIQRGDPTPPSWVWKWKHVRTVEDDVCKPLAVQFRRCEGYLPPVPQPFSSNWPFAAMPTSTRLPCTFHQSGLRALDCMYVMRMSELPLVRPYANSAFFPAEKINKFAISKDEYMWVWARSLLQRS